MTTRRTTATPCLLTALFTMALTSSACGGQDEEPPLEVHELAPGQECEEGGVLLKYARTERVVCHGVDGEDGAQGARGADGQDGLNGVDGADGADGADGRSITVERVELAPGEEGCVEGGTRLVIGVEGEEAPRAVETLCRTSSCPPGEAYDARQRLCVAAWTLEFEGFVSEVVDAPEVAFGDACRVQVTLDASTAPRRLNSGELYAHAPSSIHGVTVETGATATGLELRPMDKIGLEARTGYVGATHVTLDVTQLGLEHPGYEQATLHLLRPRPETGHALALPRSMAELSGATHLELSVSGADPWAVAFRCELTAP